MKTSGIYAIVLVADGQRYVGSAVNIYKRWLSHQSGLRNGNHRNIRLQRIWDQYGGAKAFRWDILELCPIDQLIHCEQRHINERAEFNLAMTVGSRSGLEASIEARAKIAESNSRRMRDPVFKEKIKSAQASSETREKMRASSQLRWSKPEERSRASASHIGKQNSKGRILSQETKNKISVAAKLRYSDPEFRNLQRIAMTGKTPTQATRDKLSASRKLFLATTEGIAICESMRISNTGKIGQPHTPITLARQRATMISRGHWKK